jgi:pimeloyl-ACP methyl ester carboxylesterase
MPYADVNGQRVFYEDTGAGGGVVIFSHGYFMSHAMFDAQVAALRDRWRCIAWDERGHGQTETTAEPFSYWDSASDLFGLLDHLGVERAVLAGMSQGGYLSLRAALMAPDRVRALVLMDTQPGVEDPEKAAGYDQLIEAWVSPEGPPQEVVDTVAAIILGPGYADAARWMDAAKQIPPATVRQIYSTLMTREDDVTPRLAELTMPALVIHGEQDLAIDLDSARMLADALPDGELVVIEGAGHAANLTHADAVNPPLEAFLARV